MMRGACGLIGIGFCFLSLLTGAAAQEPEKPLTAEEIVAKNEASWKKLGRVAVSYEAKNRMSVGSSRASDSGDGKMVIHDHESTSKGRLYFDESRACAIFRVRDAERESKEIFESDLLIHVSPEHVSYEKMLDHFPRVDRYTFGRTLAFFHMYPQVTFRDWVAQAHPVVSKSTGADGNPLWTLTGVLTPPKMPKQVKEIPPQKVSVAFNPARGYLVERIDFESEKAAHELAPKASHWIIGEWRDLGEGVFFPGKIHCDVTYWNRDEVSYLDEKITDLKRDPADFDEQFKVVIPPGATVYDNTGRPGVAPIVVYGKDGKPARTYATRKEYDDEQNAKRIAEMVKYQEETVGEMFPGCKVTATWDEKKRDFHTIVRSEKGELIREFKSNEELAVLVSLQELIRVGLGDKKTEKKVK